MSFALLSWRDTLRVPSTRVPIGVTTFVSYILPPVVCYFIAAWLAVTPRTHALRVALWPVMTLLALRAAVSVEMSSGNPELNILNVNLAIPMVSMTVHVYFWTFAKKPLVRYLRPANSSPSVIMDSLDLATNLRGRGWEWSHGLRIPRETRPTNRLAFGCYALLSGVVNSIMGGVLYVAIQTFITGVASSTHGFTIFDDSFPFLVRYLRAYIITILGSLAVPTVIMTNYNTSSGVAVLLLGQDPAQWPPVFDNPWVATSLNDFWGRRWHQLFRHMFIVGAYPFTAVFGRVGTLVGTFLSSGVYHYVMILALDSRTELWRWLVGFGMMAPGVLLERAIFKSTGRKVGGLVGWVWAMAWVIVWGSFVIDGFARGGLYVTTSSFRSSVPLFAFVEKSVVAFDAWLHTI